MRFLMAAMRFPTAPGEAYLTTELADALCEAGHEVEVLHLDWDAQDTGSPRWTTTESGIRVLRVPARRIAGLRGAIGNAAKFAMSGRAAVGAARRHLDLAGFDAFIGWMPASATAPLATEVRRAGIAHRHLFIWDFFPDHHHEIGRIPGGLPLWLARFFEQRALRRFVSIFCTMPANARYLRDRFRLSAGQRVAITPIWARLRPELAIDRASERATHRLPAESPIAVFGGQMVAGRGFEQILVAARHALADGSPLRFLLIGDGPLASTIAARAVDLPNVEFRLPVPREDYLRLIAACDVGLAVTVIGVTSFSFPSKILDYLAAGLPVVASLEPGNEACEILESFGVGVSVPLDDARELFLSAEQLAVDPLARVRAREGGRRCLEDVFDVRHTVSALLRESA